MSAETNTFNVKLSPDQIREAIKSRERQLSQNEEIFLQQLRTKWPHLSNIDLLGSHPDIPANVQKIVNNYLQAKSQVDTSKEKAVYDFLNEFNSQHKSALSRALNNLAPTPLTPVIHPTSPDPLATAVAMLKQSLTPEQGIAAKPEQASQVADIGEQIATLKQQVRDKLKRYTQADAMNSEDISELYIPSKEEKELLQKFSVVLAMAKGWENLEESKKGEQLNKVLENISTLSQAIDDFDKNKSSNEANESERFAYQRKLFKVRAQALRAKISKLSKGDIAKSEAINQKLTDIDKNLNDLDQINPLVSSSSYLQLRNTIFNLLTAAETEFASTIAPVDRMVADLADVPAPVVLQEPSAPVVVQPAPAPSVPPESVVAPDQQPEFSYTPLSTLHVTTLPEYRGAVSRYEQALRKHTRLRTDETKKELLLLQAEYNDYRRYLEIIDEHTGNEVAKRTALISKLEARADANESMVDRVKRAFWTNRAFKAATLAAIVAALPNATQESNDNSAKLVESGSLSPTIASAWATANDAESPKTPLEPVLLPDAQTSPVGSPVTPTAAGGSESMSIPAVEIVPPNLADMPDLTAFDNQPAKLLSPEFVVDTPAKANTLVEASVNLDVAPVASRIVPTLPKTSTSVEKLASSVVDQDSLLAINKRLETSLAQLPATHTVASGERYSDIIAEYQKTLDTFDLPKIVLGEVDTTFWSKVFAAENNRIFAGDILPLDLLKQHQETRAKAAEVLLSPYSSYIEEGDDSIIDAIDRSAKRLWPEVDPEHLRTIVDHQVMELLHQDPNLFGKDPRQFKPGEIILYKATDLILSAVAESLRDLPQEVPLTADNSASAVPSESLDNTDDGITSLDSSLTESMLAQPEIGLDNLTEAIVKYPGGVDAFEKELAVWTKNVIGIGSNSWIDTIVGNSGRVTSRELLNLDIAEVTQLSFLDPNQRAVWCRDNGVDPESFDRLVTLVQMLRADHHLPDSLDDKTSVPEVLQLQFLLEQTAAARAAEK